MALYPQVEVIVKLLKSVVARKRDVCQSEWPLDIVREFSTELIDCHILVDVSIRKVFSRCVSPLADCVTLWIGIGKVVRPASHHDWNCVVLVVGMDDVWTPTTRNQFVLAFLISTSSKNNGATWTLIYWTSLVRF